MTTSSAPLLTPGTFARLAVPVLALLLLSATASATTFTVTVFTDTAANSPANAGDGLGTGNPGDLRWSILQANAAGGTNIIDFSCASAPCTITLGGPLPPIFATATTPGGINGYNLTIDGGEYGDIIIDGGSKYRVFFVDNVAVTLNHLQIQNANATGGAGGGGDAGGGGGAGFGAGLFVNQATAVVTVENTTFANCSVAGGNGGYGIEAALDGGGGGGLGFAAGLTGSYGAGGGGVTGPGGNGGVSGGSGGSGGGGGGNSYPSNSTGGSGYADNSGGGSGNETKGGAGGFGGGGGGSSENPGAGGFGGGGGGAGIIGATNGGNAGFGGGGGGASSYGGNGGASAAAVGGVAGGAGGGVEDNAEGYFGGGSGGGGAAAGPAIFVNLGSVTLDNVSGAGFSATAGQPGVTGDGGGLAHAAYGGTSSAVAVFNYGGKVNGSTTVGPIASALPGGTAVPGTTPTSTNFGSVAVGSSITQPIYFTVASSTVVGSIGVLTQGASGLDFTDGGDSTCTAQTYSSQTDCTVNVKFTPAFAGLRMGAVVFYSGANRTGTVLATAYVYGIGTGPQIAYGPGTATAIAPTVNGEPLGYPSGVVVDAAGDLFISDDTNSRIVEMPAGGGTPVAVTPTVNGLGLDGFGGLAVDGAGDLFIADGDNHRVVEVPTGGAAIAVAASGLSLNSPEGVAVDGAGDLFIADFGGSVWQVPAGGGAAIAIDPTVDGKPLYSPFGVAVDGAGDLFIADLNNSRIVEVPAGGGAATAIDPTVNGISLAFPFDVAVDAAGDLFIADTNHVRVVEVPAGGGGAVAIDPIVNGTAVSYPPAVALDGAGDLFIADANGRVVEVQHTQPPTLSFQTTTDVGQLDSTDGPLGFTVENIGNEPLIFSVPTTGFNPSVAAGFLWDSSSTCTQTASGDSAFSLAAAGNCTVEIEFQPAGPGTNSGSVVLTDNNLNVTGATQSVGLSGTGAASSVNVTIGTNPSGLSFMIGSNTYSMTQMPSLTIGTPYTLSTTSPQPGGTGIEYVFSQWTAGTLTGADSVTLTPTISTTSDTAVFDKYYQLNVSSSSPLEGSVNIGPIGPGEPVSSGTYELATTSWEIQAVPASGYYFVNWAGNVPSDIASSTIAATIVTLNNPETITANFAPIPGYVVTNTADDGTGNAANCPGTGTNCTLRDAITAAEANSGGAGTITFSPAVFATSNTPLQNTITLLSALPTLNGQITIQGLGANIITVSGNNSATVGNIFQVNSGATVAISGLTIANGKASSNSNGGGINSAGALTVANSVFSGNTAPGAGGAIYVPSGSLTVQNSTFSSNSATNAGGGAIYAAGTSANVSYSTFYNNTSGGNGGAIAAFSPLTVSDSTFSTNTSSLSGGAIYTLASFTVVNSIFSGNSAGAAAGIAANAVTANYNLFYHNYDTGTTNEDDCNGCTTNNNPITGNPNLAPLGYYGGSTLTMLPLPASPAICAASSALIPNGVTLDQRGDPDFTTYNSTKCYDLGAVQTNYALSFNPANEPPATGTVTNVAMSPAPMVTVTESTQPFTAAAASLSVTDLKSALSPTPVPASTSTTNGQATLGNLVFATTTSSDTLTATLALNPNNTALNLTTTSTQFGVTAQAVSVTCSATTAGTVEVAFSAAETVTGGSQPYTFSVTGTLPAGLFLNTATGAITGTPLAPGPFSVGVEDKIGTVGASCPFTIAPQTGQTILLSGLPSVATYGSAGPYTLSVSGGASGNPVTFSVTGPATLKGLLLTITGAGSVTVTANQAGSGVYAPAAPVSLTLIVNQIPQAITFTGLPSQIAYGFGGPYTLTATGGGSSNPVTFSFTGPAKLSGSTLTITGVGNVVVTANQAGNTNYAAAAPVSQTIDVVNQLLPVITWATPAPMSAAIALSGVQLNATANIPGTFSYLPCAGTVLTPGPQVIIATFTPANNLLSEYGIVTAQVTLQVNPANATPIVPYIEVDGGAWQNVSSVTVNPTDTVNFGPQPVSGGKWSWTGPNGFTSKARALNAVALSSPTNVYTATYTNPAGFQSVQVFTITVNPTSIVPYIEVNGGAWQNVAGVTVNYGDTVNFGPQPGSGGSWSWTGPNGFTSTARAINGVPLTLPTNVFTATYTNQDGVTSTQVFTIMVNSTSIVPYIEVNGAAWQNVANVTVPLGSTVNLGPQPGSGGSWSWTGPGGFTSTARAINGIPLTSPANVYIATYTNPDGVTSTQAFTIAIAPTPIVPYLEVNGGAWQNAVSVTVPLGSTVNLGPQPGSGGSWSWTGPGGFTSTVRAINGIPLTSPANVYIATYTNPDGVTSTQAFTIAIAPTPIVPYLEVNGGAWQNVTSAVVAPGSTVNLGPQPGSGGSWSWTGPNGFISNSREINGIPLTSPTNTFTATYTNPAGVTSTQAFTITIAPTPIVPYLEVNGGAWQNVTSAVVAPGSTVNLGPQPGSGGSWRWTGPGGFTSTARELDGITLPSSTNSFTATYTNPDGVTSTETFIITVE